MEGFNTAETGIFWNVDDCPIPEGLDALMVCQNMRSALEKLNYRGNVFIYAYGDSSKILDDLNPLDPFLVDEISNLNLGEASTSATKPKVCVKETPHNFDYRGTTSIYTEDDPESTPALMLNHSLGDKDGILGRILIDFMMWLVDNPAPANIVLILGSNMSGRQVEFENALSQINMQSYNIHFAFPQNSLCPSLPAPHMKWLWESLSLGGSPVSEEKD